MRLDADVAIIGAGIAGASLAGFLAAHRSVLLFEQEEQPGYHATGRSAAYFAPAYGSDTVRAITAASAGFLHQPPKGFSDAPLLRKRDALYIAQAKEREQLENFTTGTEQCMPQTAAQCLARVPCLRPEAVDLGALQTGGGDLDVHAISQGFLNLAKKASVTPRLREAVLVIEHEKDCWQITTSKDQYQVNILVNAAGAWADPIATLAGVSELGLIPMRRTALTIPAPDYAESERWPLVITIEEDLYFKPEAGDLLVSPADETPSPACDAQAEELDVAIALDRYHRLTTNEVQRVKRRWAGLRTFAPDREFVSGFDPRAPNFYWLAGQGGYGVQSCPAMADIAAFNLCGHTQLLDPELASKLGEKIRPDRLV